MKLNIYNIFKGLAISISAGTAKEKNPLTGKLNKIKEFNKQKLPNKLKQNVEKKYSHIQKFKYRQIILKHINF